MMNLTYRFLVFSALGFWMFVSCSESTTSSVVTENPPNDQNGNSEFSAGAKLIASIDELPNCDETSLGYLFYILGEEEFQVCTADGYNAIELRGASGQDGADGKNGLDGESCSAQLLTDGIEIRCGDEIIDTLTNGADGADGLDGNDGADGVSLEWLGSLSEKPENPSMNQAFYWTEGRMSCIYNGTSWDVFSLDPGIPATTCEKTFIDSRDGQEYEWSIIGSQIWMAENLNYSGDDGSGNKTYETGWCYGVAGTDTTNHSDSTTCDNFGRLYTWDMVMGGAASSAGNPSGVQGICPNGWHVPSESEWTELIEYVIANSVAATLDDIAPYLKATSGWSDSGNGTDDFGFSAQAGGIRGFNGFFVSQGNNGGWLSSTISGVTGLYLLIMSNDMVGLFSSTKGYGYSLRCVQDEN